MTIGADCRFTLRRRDSAGDLVDWDADVYVNIQTTPAVTRVDAVVTGPDAVVSIESEIADVIATGVTWQGIASFPGTPSYEPPIAVGKFKRHDA